MKKALTTTVLGALLCIGSTAHAQTANIAVTGTITAKSCSVDTANVVINMGTVPLSEINAVGVGAAIARTSTGNIVFTCVTAGSNISLSMQDATNAGSTQPYLALTPGGAVAQGIGIQMFQQDGTAIALGPAGSSATWLAGTNVPAGPFTVPISARYYRTASAVSAGAANAQAVFDVTYN